MNFSAFYLKRKLGLVSFVILASLICSQQSFAMKCEGEGLGGSKGKEHKTDHAPETARTYTLEEVNGLIEQAREADEKAQNTLIALHYYGLYRSVITPDKIDFINWKSSNPENTIQNRCYHNDQYANFVGSHFDKIGKSFTGLLASIQARAEQGVAAAQNNLAMMCSHGRVVAQNNTEAIRLCTLAANQGFAAAQINLGNQYSQGRGVERDELMAFAHYRKATKTKNLCQVWLQLLKQKTLTYITLNSTAELSEPDPLQLDEILETFYAKTQVLTVDMYTLALRHNPLLSKPEITLSILPLKPHYKKIQEIGIQMDEWIRLIMDAKQLGLFITCIQPTQKLLDNYKEHPEGKQVGFYKMELDDQLYYCIDGDNPALGYKFKAFLKKKEEFLKDLDMLEFGLNCSKITLNAAKDNLKAYEKLKNLEVTIDDNKFDVGQILETVLNSQPQLAQIDEELALLSQARLAIEEGYATLTGFIQKYAGLRNKAFRDENKELLNNNN